MILITKKLAERIRRELAPEDGDVLAVIGWDLSMDAIKSSSDLFGLEVHVLPESAFEGIVDDDGKPAEFVEIDLFTKEVLPDYWGDLKSGTTSLAKIWDSFQEENRNDGTH